MICACFHLIMTLFIIEITQFCISYRSRPKIVSLKHAEHMKIIDCTWLRTISTTKNRPTPNMTQWPQQTPSMALRWKEAQEWTCAGMDRPQIHSDQKKALCSCCMILLQLCYCIFCLNKTHLSFLMGICWTKKVTVTDQNLLWSFMYFQLHCQTLHFEHKSQILIEWSFMGSSCKHIHVPHCKQRCVGSNFEQPSATTCRPLQRNDNMINFENGEAEEEKSKHASLCTEWRVVFHDRAGWTYTKYLLFCISKVVTQLVSVLHCYNQILCTTQTLGMAHGLHANNTFKLYH